MRAVVTSPEQGVQVLDVPAPVVPAEEILVAPLLVGLCGTDLELIDGTLDPGYVSYPLILGHEWVGALEHDVAELGRAGDHVVVEGIIPCGHCDACRAGDTNRCDTYDEIGFTRPGALARQVAVPRALAHRVESAVALEDAVLVEPMAVVWRALTRLPLRPRARVAIIGDGTIALLAAHMVRALDPDRVVVFGRREQQHDLARTMGADEFWVTPPEDRFDLVLEAAGATEAVATALAAADRGATIALLGLPPHGSTLAVEPARLVNDDLLMHGSFSYTRRAWAEVVARLNAGSLRPSSLITHRYSLDTFHDALATLRGVVPSPEPRGKVLVDLR